MNDLKFAFRQLLTNPACAAVALLPLAMPLLAQAESALNPGDEVSVGGTRFRFEV